MRPRKTVLYLAENEDRMGRRAFVLETKLFRVFQARTAAEALALLAAEPEVDVLVVEFPIEDFAALKVATKGLHPDLRVLALAHSDADYSSYRDAWLPESTSMAELVERVKILAAR